MAGLVLAPSRADAQRARPARLPLVVIDPGHGGSDPGAIGPAGTQEKRITLAWALELRRQLQAGGRCRVALTRTRDVFVPLGRRVDAARRREAALLISLHADAAPRGQAAGLRGGAVYTRGEQPSDSLAAALARHENNADRAGGLRLPSVSPDVQRILFSLMQRETEAASLQMGRLAVATLGRDIPMLSRPLRRADFVVLSAPDIPAVLVEGGFISHPRDEALLGQRAHRARLAAALTEAVHRFLAAPGPAG